MGIAAASDIRLADPTARFCLPPAKLGLAYPVPALKMICDGLGMQTAKYMLFTGNEMGSPEAIQCGFIHQTILQNELQNMALNIANQIGQNAPLSIQSAKLGMNGILNNDVATIENAQILANRTFDSLDYREGRQAFKEKRKPTFLGK